MHIRIYVANYSQFNVKSMFTTVYINRCCRQILLSRPCPFDQLELGNKVDMQTIITKRRSTVLLFFIDRLLCALDDLTFSFRPFASDLLRRFISKKKKPTNLNLYMNISFS